MRLVTVLYSVVCCVFKALLCGWISVCVRDRKTDMFLIEACIHNLMISAFFSQNVVIPKSSFSQAFLDYYLVWCCFISLCVNHERDVPDCLGEAIMLDRALRSGTHSPSAAR